MEEGKSSEKEINSSPSEGTSEDGEGSFQSNHSEIQSSTSEDDKEWIPPSKFHQKSLCLSPKESDPKRSPKVQLQMRTPLPNFASACDRFGVSDRTAAALGATLLTDMGQVTPTETSKVIDRSKIRRERGKKRALLQGETAAEAVEGIYFDGRKDSTCVQVSQLG